jgi:hypothetical protein
VRVWQGEGGKDKRLKSKEKKLKKKEKSGMR